MLFDLGRKDEIKDYYDVVTVGGGPAALGAAVYAKRAGLSVLVVEKTLEGGQLNLTTYIDNYLGFPSIEGQELARRMKEHAQLLGAEFLGSQVQKLILNAEQRIVKTEDGQSINAGVVMIATGAEPKKLQVPGEEKFTAKGISYCATCDGYFFKDKDVVVVGGGDTAINDALYLSKIARSVTVVHRRDKLRAVKILQDKAFANQKIKFEFNKIVESFQGDNKLQAVILKDTTTGELSTLKIDGVFIAIGLTPNSELVKGQVQTDENGYVITNEWMETSLRRVYAIGDVRKKSVRQIITAVSDGAIAAIHAAENYFS
ncbi:MAG: thioredoxin-disulfide reductase [Pseudothermotoga sp.]